MTFKERWVRFEAWVAEKLPGWKVKALNLGSAIYNTAILLKAVLDESGIQQVVEQKYLVAATIIINVLTIWLRDISARVEERKKSLGNS